MDIRLVADALRDKFTNTDRPILIGIEGFGGSGKTTISRQLAEALGDTHVIHIDDFIVKEKLLEKAWDTGVFDHARLEHQVLKPVTLGQTVRYQKLLYDTNKLSEYTTIESAKYIIVEGIACYITSLRHYYDFKIWVNTSIDLAMARGIARDGTHGNADDWQDWAQIDLLYVNKYTPDLVADFIITNQ